jgi:hypothetical protein
MTGGKPGKKAKILQDELTPSQALLLRDKLQGGADVKTLELLQAIGASRACGETIYDKSCKTKKDNPNCFCNFLPLPGSSRKKGLWQKDPEALKKLGDDPADEKREVLPLLVNHLNVLEYILGKIRDSLLRCWVSFQSGLGLERKAVSGWSWQGVHD